MIPDYIDKWEKIRWGRSGLEAELCGVLRIRSTLGRHQTNPIAPQAHSQASPTTWKGTAPLVHGSAVEAQPAFPAVRYLVPQLMILLSAPRQGPVPVPQQHQAKKESHSFLYLPRLPAPSQVCFLFSIIHLFSASVFLFFSTPSSK